MGYYADGSGCITFRRELKPAQENEIRELLMDAGFDVDFYQTRHNKSNLNPHGPIGVDFYNGDKYYGDDVEIMLQKISAAADIESGALEYCGEDSAHWRFLYKPEDGKWHEQNGRVVYEE